MAGAQMLPGGVQAFPAIGRRHGCRKRPIVTMRLVASMHRPRMSGRSPPSRRVEVSAQGDDAGDVASDVLRKVSDAVSAAGRGLGRAGTVGFWVQLVLCTISAVVLVFSILFKGFTKGTDVGLYFILFGLLAGFLSCAWSFGYIRLGRKLMDSSSDPKNAPPRSQVQSTLQFGVGINLVGLGSTIVGLQATTGLLFAKTLSTTAANPFVVGGARNFNPVLALDIFLVQAAANTLLSHFVSSAISLSLIRAIFQQQQEQQPVEQSREASET